MTQYIECDTTDYMFKKYMYNLYTQTTCALKYYSNNENTFEANEILEGIYLGNINSVYDIKKLKELKIKRVISVIDGFTPPYPEDFEYLVINALDNENTDLSKNFEVTNNFIEDSFVNNKNILIHCSYGRSRSATILAAYFIKTFGYNVKTSIDSIKNKRTIIEPNTNFLSQLEKYYIKLYPPFS
jgi:protein-tyrosine phosphatase